MVIWKYKKDCKFKKMIFNVFFYIIFEQMSLITLAECVSLVFLKIIYLIKNYAILVERCE